MEWKDRNDIDNEPSFKIVERNETIIGDKISWLFLSIAGVEIENDIKKEEEVKDNVNDEPGQRSTFLKCNAIRDEERSVH